MVMYALNVVISLLSCIYHFIFSPSRVPIYDSACLALKVLTLQSYCLPLFFPFHSIESLLPFPYQPLYHIFPSPLINTFQMPTHMNYFTLPSIFSTPTLVVQSLQPLPLTPQFPVQPRHFTFEFFENCQRYLSVRSKIA